MPGVGLGDLCAVGVRNISAGAPEGESGAHSCGWDACRQATCPFQRKVAELKLLFLANGVSDQVQWMRRRTHKDFITCIPTASVKRALGLNFGLTYVLWTVLQSLLIELDNRFLVIYSRRYSKLSLAGCILLSGCFSWNGTDHQVIFQKFKVNENQNLFERQGKRRKKSLKVNVSHTLKKTVEKRATTN